MNRAANAYSTVTVQTNTNKQDILIQLYEGAIRFVDAARNCMVQRDIAKKGEYISRVIAIITELDSALDRKVGGEIAENLSNLYGHMVRQLTKAGIRNDPAILDEVKGLLQTLLDAWLEASEQLTPNKGYPVHKAEESREQHQGGLLIAL